jgi:hypothetical protein
MNKLIVETKTDLKFLFVAVIKLNPVIIVRHSN